MTDPKLRRNIAINVQAHLQTRGWSQAELAKRTGESAARISLMVRGKKLPTVEMLLKVAKVFDTTVDALLRDPVLKNSSAVA